MKTTLFLLISFLCSMIMKSQSTFSVTYNFNGSYSSNITEGSEAITVEDAVIGGTKLSNIGFLNEDGQTVLKSTITNNNATNYTNSFVRMNIKPKTGYTFVITGFVVNQKSTKIGNNYFFRQAVTLNQTKPNNGDLGSATANTSFLDTYTDHSFIPSIHVSKGKESDYTTLWLAAKEPGTTTYDWHINSIVITGKYIRNDTETPGLVSVTNSIKQKLRFGIDAERLWYWKTGSFGNTLADLAVKEIESEFVRVAVSSAYEREEGVINSAAYDKILDMMTAMKLSNPDIKFFASPRPLDEAYTAQEEIDIWGGKCPWSPAPTWVIPWTENGTNSDGTTKWKIGAVKAPELTRFYADYLNFMHNKGFKIEYLDITNEKNDISAFFCKYLFDNIPSQLNEGVYMPELIAPSSWSFQQGVAYLNDFTESQLSSFTIAASHNTNAAGSPEEFAIKANSINKEPWNTELHGWVGISTQDEVVTSKYFFDHINSGIVGLDTWLFFGPKDGKDHTMVWANSDSFTRSSKYYIFKKVVNNANGGNYIETTSSNELTATSFIKNNTTMVCVLNESDFDKPNTEVDFGIWNINNKSIEVTQYGSNDPREGTVTNTSTSKGKILFNAKAKSLFIFKVENILSTEDIIKDESQLSIYPNPTSDNIYIKSLNDNLIGKSYQVIGINGSEIITGVLNKERPIDVSTLNNGMYILKINGYNNTNHVFKFFMKQ